MANTVEYKDQYRAISEDETAADAALSVSYCWHMSRNINNLKKVTGSDIVQDAAIPWKVFTDSSNEAYVTDYIWRWSAPGFNKVALKLGHSKQTGAAGTVDWKIYLSTAPYRSVGDPFDVNNFGNSVIKAESGNKYVTVQSSVTAHKNDDGDSLWPLPDSAIGGMYFVTVTSTRSVGTANAHFNTLTLIPIISGTGGEEF